MKKIMIFMMMLFVLLASSMPVLAESEPVIYKDTITVTEEGGRYQVGFAGIEFKKKYMDASKLPVTFEVQIYAEDGVAYIEFDTDVPQFIKKVHIRTNQYNGLLFDKSTGENIKVNVKNQQVLAGHFSRWAFH